MLVEASSARTRSAHVVVLGNEKGGSGKSTVAMHVAVALMNAGQSVATVDLDSRQQSFTHYIANRQTWARRAQVGLPIPSHHCVARAEGIKIDANEETEFARFVEVIGAVEHTHDFIVIDTPGNDTYLMRLAHSMADTLVTPLNDSFVDFDVLGTVDPLTYAVTGTSHYAEMIRETRRQRRLVDDETTDWIVLRNRLSTLGSLNKRLVGAGLHELARRLGFRCADGIAERVVYREFFPRGLTALDDLDEITLGTKPGQTHATARQEVLALMDALKLPLDERGRRRAAARSEWFAAAAEPLQVHDFIVD